MTAVRVDLREALADAALAQVGEMLSRSFDVKALDQADGALTLVVNDAVPSNELQKRLKQVIRARRYATGACLFSRSVPDHRDADPQPALEAKGDVAALGPGLFAFRGDFLRVRTALDGLVRAIAGRCGAQDLAYPPLWPVGVLQSINYFHDFPQLAMLAAGVAPHYEARHTFAGRFRKGSGDTVIACTAENGLAPAANALAPTVCDCCYWLLRGRRDVADQILTIHGQVFRNETSAHGRIDRLTGYTMREIVLIGSEAFVLARRETLVDEVIELVTSLDLACTVQAADDPFFSNDALLKNSYQNMAELKYEVVAPLFGGGSTAVASVNLHNDFFSRSYDYQDREGNHLASACVAFGYERMVYALFCRHGAEFSAWPEPVRAALGLNERNETDTP